MTPGLRALSLLVVAAVSASCGEADRPERAAVAPDSSIDACSDAQRIVAVLDRGLSRGRFDDVLHETVLPATGSDGEFETLPGIWTAGVDPPRLDLGLVPGVTPSRCRAIVDALEAHERVGRVRVFRNPAATGG